MNDRQTRLYRVEWNKTRKALRTQGMAPKEAEAQRHALHIRALGQDKSSTLLTNADFDRVLQEFRAISQPANATTQVELEQMPATRARHYIRQLLAALGKGDNYAEAIVSRMNSGRRQRSTGAGRLVTLDTLSEPDLHKLKIALKTEIRRLWPTKESLLSEISIWIPGLDVPDETTTTIISDALSFTDWMLAGLDYEQLLKVLAALHNTGLPAQPADADDVPF